MRTPCVTSPYNLMQERYRNDPWALLVGCIIFNMVHGSKAQPVHEEFLARWPRPESLINWNKRGILNEMTSLFRTLGLQNRRAKSVIDMTADWVYYGKRIHDPSFDISKLYGVGKYASDSFNMFFRGYLVRDAQDKELRKYVEWAKDQPEGAGESLREIACQAPP